MVTISKMPHSTFKGKSEESNSGIAKCPCGQTFDYASERDQEKKHQLHCKFCSNQSEGSKQIRKPMKAMMPREQQLDYAERKRKVYENHEC